MRPRIRPRVLLPLLGSLLCGVSVPATAQAPPKIFVSVDIASTTHVDILQSIPGVRKVDGFTVEYTAQDADEAYQLIRFMYRFVRV